MTIEALPWYWGAMQKPDAVVVGPPMGKGQRFRIDRLRSMMEGLGLSAESMAGRIREESGETLSGETIRNWLAGKNFPQVRHLHALADAFGIDIRMFFDPEEGAPRPVKATPRRRKAS